MVNDCIWDEKNKKYGQCQCMGTVKVGVAVAYKCLSHPADHRISSLSFAAMPVNAPSSERTLQWILSTS